MLKMTSQSAPSRLNRATNDIFDATSFLQGTNAAFIESLYAQYQENPDAVDETWRAYFASLSEPELTATQLGRGPAWRRDTRPGACERRSGRRAHRPVACENEREREGRARRGAGIHPRHPDGARLSRHRPSRGRARSAEPVAQDPACTARTFVLRLPSRGPRPSGLRRGVLGMEDRHTAPHGGDPQAHLLRAHRLRVHAHQRRRAEGTGCSAASKGPTRRFPSRPRQARDPEQADRGGRLREIQRRALPRHQTLWPRRRRIHDPGGWSRSSSAAASSA